MIVQESNTRTSAQIALEDKIFHELFGMVWQNGGYTIKSAQDLSWAIFYKDMFLQALADYANDGFVKMVNGREFLINDSAKMWVELPSPFNDENAIEMLVNKLSSVEHDFCKQKRTKAETIKFYCKMKRAREKLFDQDPFSFDRCCDVLGIDPEVGRARFKLYRMLKEKHGDGIRIVTYTGKKENLNIPSLDDIINAEEANGEQDLTLFLHIGVKRELRNRALVRSKNERSDKRDTK